MKQLLCELRFFHRILLTVTILMACSTLVLAESELWVAVGYGGRRMISTDGVHWEITAEWAQPGRDDSNNLMGLVYAEGQFVAVGGGGGGKTGGGHVLISTDGRQWTEVWEAPNRVNPIIYGNGRFIAGGPGQRLFISSDAESWQEGAKLQDKRCTHFRHAVFGNDRFIITGNHGGNSEAWICMTKNGESVSHTTFEIPSIRDIQFADGTFIIVGEGVRLYSTDGINWKSTGLDSNERLTWVIHLKEEWLCGGGKNVYSSHDGQNWKIDERRFRGSPKWTDGKRIISTGWPGKMYFSPDSGKTWQNGNELTANGINKVVKANLE